MLRIDSFASLRHCIFALNRITFRFAFSADDSLATAAMAPNMHAAVIREPTAALSSIHRASRTAIVLIQRIHANNPPVISAGKMQTVQ